METTIADPSFGELSEHYALEELERVLEASADGSHTEERRYTEAREVDVRSLMDIW